MTIMEGKLQAAGHSSLYVDKLRPDDPVKKLLFRAFTGRVAEHPFKGLLVLHDAKLSQVLLTWDAQKGNERAIEALFVARYGKPRRMGPPDYERVWTSSHGERLKFDTNMRFGRGSIFASYLSPTL